jgi:hypothetical protein
VEEEAPAAAREKLRAAVTEHVSDERERRLVEPPARPSVAPRRALERRSGFRAAG